mmetsp:Transcript_95496/g.270063  ORF Transcript_95496/g.270063 Transcript_95496/m.270063 type:complete len:237 (-) Transcript_95496:2297-3007(-)
MRRRTRRKRKMRRPTTRRRKFLFRGPSVSSVAAGRGSRARCTSSSGLCLWRASPSSICLLARSTVRSGRSASHPMSPSSRRCPASGIEAPEVAKAPMRTTKKKGRRPSPRPRSSGLSRRTVSSSCLAPLAAWCWRLPTRSRKFRRKRPSTPTLRPFVREGCSATASRCRSRLSACASCRPGTRRARKAFQRLSPSPPRAPAMPAFPRRAKAACATRTSRWRLRTGACDFSEPCVAR